MTPRLKPKREVEAPTSGVRRRCGACFRCSTADYCECGACLVFKAPDDLQAVRAAQAALLRARSEHAKAQERRQAQRRAAKALDAYRRAQAIKVAKQAERVRATDRGCFLGTGRSRVVDTPAPRTRTLNPAIRQLEIDAYLDFLCTQ